MFAAGGNLVPIQEKKFISEIIELLQNTAQRVKFSIKDLKLKFPADLVTFTEEILNRKLHFLRSENYNQFVSKFMKLDFHLLYLY